MSTGLTALPATGSDMGLDLDYLSLQRQARIGLHGQERWEKESSRVLSECTNTWGELVATQHTGILLLKPCSLPARQTPTAPLG